MDNLPIWKFLKISEVQDEKIRENSVLFWSVFDWPMRIENRLQLEFWLVNLNFPAFLLRRSKVLLTVVHVEFPGVRVHGEHNKEGPQLNSSQSESELVNRRVLIG